MVYDVLTMPSVTSLVLVLRDRRRATFNRVIRSYIRRGFNPVEAISKARVELSAPRPVVERCEIFPFRSRA